MAEKKPYGSGPTPRCNCNWLEGVMIPQAVFFAKKPRQSRAVIISPSALLISFSQRERANCKRINSGEDDDAPISCQTPKYFHVPKNETENKVRQGYGKFVGDAITVKICFVWNIKQLPVRRWARRAGRIELLPPLGKSQNGWREVIKTACCYCQANGGKISKDCVCQNCHLIPFHMKIKRDKKIKMVCFYVFQKNVWPFARTYIFLKKYLKIK